MMQLFRNSLNVIPAKAKSDLAQAGIYTDRFRIRLLRAFTGMTLIILTSLILTGCSHQKTNPTPSPSPSPAIQSSGDVDKELDEIDKQLQEVETEDTPTLDEKSLGL